MASSAGDDAPVMVNSVPGAESVESSAESADLQTFKLPEWYRGKNLPETVTRISCHEKGLRGLDFETLHNIFVEKMTNPQFSAVGICRYLGIHVDSIYPACWRHNNELIEFGSFDPNTSVTHKRIRNRTEKWIEYRKFVDEQGGCRNPFHPEEVARVLFPTKGMDATIVKRSAPRVEWFGGWRQSILSRDSRLAKVADQVSGIVLSTAASSGDQSPPFPPPRAPPHPHLKP